MPSDASCIDKNAIDSADADAIVMITAMPMLKLCHPPNDALSAHNVNGALDQAGIDGEAHPPPGLDGTTMVRALFTA